MKKDNPTDPMIAVEVSKNKKRHGNPLRTLAAFTHFNWEDYNLQPALEFFGQVIRLRWPPNNQYAKNWHTSGKQAFNRRFLELVKAATKASNVDLFFSYASGRLLFPSTVRTVGLMELPTLNIFLDDRKKFYGPLEPTGYAGMVDIANAYSLCWTTDRSAVAKYKSVGAQVIYLPPGANPHVFRPQDVARDIDVLFVGQNYGCRQNLISRLLESGINVKTFGKGWGSGEITMEEMVTLFSRARITLGIGTVGESSEVLCVKGRDFEVPMCGGFYLTQENSDLKDWFEIGKEIACYRNTEDLVDKIGHYLDHPQEAEEIRRAGLRRALKDHTWVQRFGQVLKTMGILNTEHQALEQLQATANAAVETKDDWTYYLRVGEESASSKKESIRQFVLSKKDIKSVVDVGCNTGEMSAQFQKHGIDVMGLDASNNLRLREDYQFVPCDITHSNAIFLNDCTLFLSLYHHVFWSKGRDVADEIFYKLLLRSKYLIFDCGNVQETSPYRHRWVKSLKKHFFSEKDLIDHFGIPYQSIGSWETGGANRSIVVFERDAFDKNVEVLDEFRRKPGTPAQKEGLFSIKAIKKSDEFFNDTHFFKLRLGNKHFFAKKHLDRRWEASELENTIEVYEKFPKEGLLTFYGISERFGLIYEWVDDMRYLGKLRDVMVCNVLLEDADYVQVGDQTKIIDFWSDPKKKKGNEKYASTDAGTANLSAKGKDYIAKKDLEGARRCFREVLALDQNNVEGIMNLGAVEFESGRLDDAIRLFSKAILINDSGLKAVTYMGQCHDAKGEYHEALKYFEKAIHIGGATTDILNRMGKCHVQLNDLDNAMVAYASSLRLDNSQELVRRLLVDVESAKRALVNEIAYADWEAKGRPMPPPHLFKQEVVRKYADRFLTDVLVETGTFLGAMVLAMKNHFSAIYSIELDHELATKAKRQFGAYDHIHIIEGDSGECLQGVLSTVEKPCLFWLDGHYSGGITAKGDQETPIIKELECIFSHPVDGHVILIDDARCFTGEKDYPSLETLKESVLKTNSGLVFQMEDDIIRIHRDVGFYGVKTLQKAAKSLDRAYRVVP